MFARSIGVSEQFSPVSFRKGATQKSGAAHLPDTSPLSAARRLKGSLEGAT